MLVNIPSIYLLKTIWFQHYFSFIYSLTTDKLLFKNSSTTNRFEPHPTYRGLLATNEPSDQRTDCGIQSIIVSCFVSEQKKFLSY